MGVWRVATVGVATIPPSSPPTTIAEAAAAVTTTAAVTKAIRKTNGL